MTKSAAIFCHQVAARALNMFSKFYFIESTKLPITQQLLTIEKKISTDLKSLKLKTNFNMFTEFKNNLIKKLTTNF
jgi:hypothetical protein